MRIDYAGADDIRFVAYRMRAADYREFSALSATTNRKQLARHLARRYAGSPDVMAVWPEGSKEPAAVGGLLEHRPGVLTALFLATDAFPSIAMELTIRIKREFLPQVKTTGVHRIEAVSLVGHTEAHRWIRHFGLKPEGPPMRGYGKNGEAYQQFAWVSDACPAGA